MKRKLAAILMTSMLLSVFSMGAFAEGDTKSPTASFDEKVTLNDAGEIMPCLLYTSPSPRDER